MTSAVVSPASPADRAGCTLLVARRLTPEDHRLAGMASMYIGMVAPVNEIGLGTAIIRRREASDDNTPSVPIGGAALTCVTALPGAEL